MWAPSNNIPRVLSGSWVPGIGCRMLVSDVRWPGVGCGYGTSSGTGSGTVLALFLALSLPSLVYRTTPYMHSSTLV